MVYSLTPFPAFSDDPPHSLPRFLHSLPFMTSLLFPAHAVLSHTSTLFLCDPSIWSSKPSPTSNTATKPVLRCLKTLLKHLFSFRGFPNVLSSMLCHHSLSPSSFPLPHTMKVAFMKVYISPPYICSISCVTLFWHSHTTLTSFIF